MMADEQRIHWKSLPDDVRERVAAISHCRVPIHKAQRDPRVPLLTHRARHSRVWVYAIVAATGVWLAVALWFWELRDVRSPGFGDNGTEIFALLAALILVPLFLFVGNLVARRDSPFAPGLFLTATDLIDTRDAVLRIVPLDACQVVAADHRVNFVIHSHASMSFVPRRGKPFTFPSLSRQEVTDVSGALAAYSRDPAARAAADAFASMRDRNGRIDRPAAARGSILRRVLPIVIGLGLAIPIGYVVADLRQQAHDDAAFAAAETRADKLEYAKWGRRGPEIRAALGIRDRKTDRPHRDAR
jgi:hypothetical protein